MNTIPLDMSAYARLIRSYSAEDLEDIYQNINVLQYPARYRLLLDEMAMRGLEINQQPASSVPTNLVEWIAGRPLLRNHPFINQAIIALFLLAISSVATFGLLAPIWVFAMKWHFLNLPIAMIFLAFLPTAPVVSAGFARRLGARGWHILPVLMGILLGLWLFDTTGTLSALTDALAQPVCTSGGGFPVSL